MGHIRQSIVVAVVLACIALIPGCMEGDPAGKILKTRKLWKVDLSSFVLREDGAISAQFRLSGPVNSRLQYLTVKLELLDVSGQVLAYSWESFDLRDVKRGGPVERFITIPGPDGEGMVESIRLDPVHYPEPDEYAHIVELAGLAPPVD